VVLPLPFHVRQFCSGSGLATFSAVKAVYILYAGCAAPAFIRRGALLGMFQNNLARPNHVKTNRRGIPEWAREAGHRQHWQRVVDKLRKVVTCVSVVLGGVFCLKLHCGM